MVHVKTILPSTHLSDTIVDRDAVLVNKVSHGILFVWSMVNFMVCEIDWIASKFARAGKITEYREDGVASHDVLFACMEGV